MRRPSDLTRSIKDAARTSKDRDAAKRRMEGENAVIIEMELDVGTHGHKGGTMEITATGDVTRYVNGKANDPTTNFFDRMPQQFDQVGSTSWLDRIALVDRAGRVLGEYVKVAGSWSRLR